MPTQKRTFFYVYRVVRNHPVVVICKNGKTRSFSTSSHWAEVYENLLRKAE